jgi:hypothetical protein
MDRNSLAFGEIRLAVFVELTAAVGGVLVVPGRPII